MERPSKRTKLLSDSESEGSDDDNQQGVKLENNAGDFKINDEYARRFEHNKKREDLSRLEEKYGKKIGKNGKPQQDDEDDESSTDEEEDDDADLVTADLDDEIMDTLQAIKNKDPRVYNKDVKFYRDFVADAAAAPAKDEAKKEKPMTLRDYHRQNLLAGYTGGDDDEDAGDVPQTYNQEQDALRREMVGQMHAMGDADAKPENSEDDDFKPKAKGAHDSISATKTKSKKRNRRITETDIASADKDPETYLSNFMAAQAWRPAEGTRAPALDSDDSEEDKRADEFENAYNMRFEDPATANEKLQSFARDVGKYSVRRDEVSGRKKAREREREKKEAEKREREEDRARLRRLKIEEAEGKLKRIKEAAGLRGKNVDLEQWRDVLEDDFDDADWDKEMQRRFGDEYYADQEAGDDSDGEMPDAGSKKRKVKKPTWDDDIDVKDIVPDFDYEERAKYALSDEDQDDDEEGGAPLPAEDDEDDAVEEGGKKRKTKKDRLKEKSEAKRSARKERRALEEMVDASLPLSNPALATSSSKAPVTGFRYRETSPTNYGLSARDILFADDSQLNSYVGLKKLATWRDEEKKAKEKKKLSKKGRLRQWRKETFGKPDEPQGGFEVVLGHGEDVADDGRHKGKGEEGNVKEGERKRKRSKGKKRKAAEVEA